MGIQISGQLAAFGQSILLGAAAGVLYDLLRPFRLRLPRLTALLDGAYCLAVGCAAFLFLLRRGGGELRGFLLLGAAGGAVLFFCAASAFLQPLWAFWADTLVHLVRLLLLPFLVLRKICKKTFQHGKNLFYFAGKYYTIIKITGKAQRRRGMKKKSKNARPRSSLLTKLVILALLAAIGWKLYDLRAQVAQAETEKAQISAQVEQQRQENAALEADIAEGTTPEKMEEIAREELDLVMPNEYVFYGISN